MAEALLPQPLHYFFNGAATDLHALSENPPPHFCICWNVRFLKTFEMLLFTISIHTSAAPR